MKSGIQTSEFWLALVSAVGLIAITMTLILTDQVGEIGGVLTAVGVGLAGISGTYSAGRSWIKGQVGGRADSKGPAGLE